MSTSVAALVNRLRTEFLDDAIAAEEDDFAWPSAVLVSALNTAHKELAKRLLLIEDSTTPAICQLTLAEAGGAFPRTLAFDSRVLRIERLKFPGIPRPLQQVSQAFLDERDSGWDEKTGNPEAFFINPSAYTITFNREPVSGGTVYLTVKRKPLADFTTAGLTKANPETIELPGLEDELCHGALKYAYLRDDKKTFDATRAKVWAAQFEEGIRQIIRQQAAMSAEAPIMRSDWW